MLLGGEEKQITISGKSHNDAISLADALVSNDCVVMHYSTVSKDDPKCELYPYELGLANPQSLMELARAAYKTFSQHPEVQNRPLAVLGFSMGAQRAVLLAKENSNIASIVLLSGAQMSATSKDDRGGNVHREASKSISEPSVDVYDFDDDGVVHLWEISGVLAINARNQLGKMELPTQDNSGMPFAEPILDVLKKPTLALYGSLDEYQSCHAVILSDKLSMRTWLDIRVIPNVGHQLGSEEDGKIGPISASISKTISQWLLAQ
jgi:pimeloyl-ACP methyl ester carboxylesterase